MTRRDNCARGLKRKALLQGAQWMVGAPVFRRLLLRRLKRQLRQSYDEKEKDPERLRYLKWFGRHLEAFAERLILERPSAARAALRFADTWVRDMDRRAAMRAEGLPTPVTAVIEPTDRCNLKCPGCYAASSRGGSDMPFERLVDIVQQIVDMGVTLITISGGEPFIRELEDQVISRLAEEFNSHAFLVYTNGTLIDRQAARRLGEVGNVFPAISVEGFEHETDARRGGGIYQRDRCARERLAEHEVMHGFSATVTRENAELIAGDEFIEKRIEEGDLFGWFFLLQPIGRSPRPDLMVTADQRAMLRESIFRWRAENRPIFLGDFWNDGHLAGGCIAGGAGYFHIYANGDISPCVFSPVSCANIHDVIEGRSEYRTLAEVVREHPFFAGVRERQRTITDRRAPCILIDHPELFRSLCAEHAFKPGRNMPEDYLQGEIADAITRRAEEWEKKLACMPELPDCVMVDVAELQTA
ncbi:MAG: radical SAM protein [Planctomycetes bacterium]|nr:radical SAM protein [Planctomycetota bacterium]